MLAVCSHLHKITRKKRKTVNFRGGTERCKLFWTDATSSTVESRHRGSPSHHRLDRLRYLCDHSQLLAADSSPCELLALAAAFPVSSAVASLGRDVVSHCYGYGTLARPDGLSQRVVLDSGGGIVLRGPAALQAVSQHVHSDATRRIARDPA